MKRAMTIVSMVIIIAISTTSQIVKSKTIELGDSLNDNVKRDLLILMLAYPDHIKTIEKNQDGSIFILMNDGRKVIYDDNKTKLEEDKYVNPDLQDLLDEPYPLESISEVMGLNKDPGRLRHYGLLASVYGDSRQSIERNLIRVDTYYGSISFNKSNGAATNLKKALDEVGSIEETKLEIKNFVTPLSGTYNYRVIQDTKLLSPHSYGIAIDLKRDDSDYWKWASKDKGNSRIASYPKELVNIFEKYGFVWGGKWSHFDILHFEYKPEVILKSRYFGENINGKNKNWYDGIPREERVNNYITLIDKVIDG